MIEYMPNLLVLQNEYANLVTSLPYIDEKISDSDKNRVNDLIKSELAHMPVKDYLENFPLPKLSFLVGSSIFSFNNIIGI